MGERPTERGLSPHSCPANSNAGGLGMASPPLVSARIAALRTNQPGLNTLIVTVRTNPQTEAALAKYAYLQALGVCRSPGRRAGLEVDAPLLHPPTQPDL